MFIKPNSEAHFTSMASKKEDNADACTDKNCPHHGSLKARGQVFDGTVISARMQKTIRVEWPFMKYWPKYERYEKRRTRLMAHLPSCIAVKVGDKVRIAECRPLSRNIKFVVYQKL